jgi:hypothetical protein
MRRGWFVLVAVLLAAACSAPAPPLAASQGWLEVPSPQVGARVLVMAAPTGGLVAFGSVPGPDRYAPAAWSTADARTWTALPLTPATGYGRQAELTMAAADGARVSAWGQAFGGAHSNPRPTLWNGTAAQLTEHEQSFILFGGEDAIATVAEAASAGTFLLAGAWDGASGRYGAAVWTSPDGEHWTRSADAPGLASGPGEQTFARGAAAGPGGFLLLGSTQLAAGGTLPLAWTPNPDGSWHRIPLPSSGPAVATTAACDAAGCVVVGTTADVEQRPVCWTLTDGVPGARHDGPGTGVLGVTQALLAGGRVYTVSDAGHHARLDVLDRDCTNPASLPVPAEADGAALAALGGMLVLSTTTPDGGRMWTRVL